jgi:hypothetical protein
MLRDFFNFGFLRRSRRPNSGRPRGARKTGRYRPELLALENRTLPSTISWLHPVSGDWNDSANWSGGRVPLTTDDVVIPFRGITVTHATDHTDNARTLRSEADLDISAGRLTIGIGGTFTSSLIDALVTVSDNGTLTFFNDSVGGAGTLRNFANLNLGGAGSVDVGSDGVVDVAVDNEAGVLTVFGVLNNDAARPFVNGPDATLNVAPAAFQQTDVQIANGFTNEGHIEIPSFFSTLILRQGTLVNAPGATINFLNGGFIQANLDNQGTVTVVSPGNANAGHITGAVTNEGTMTVGQGFTLAVGGATFEQDGMVSGPGTLRLVKTIAESGPGAVTTVGQLAVIESTLTSATPLTNLVLLEDGSTINAAVVNQGTLTVLTDLAPDASPLNTINGSLTNVAGATLDVMQATLAATQGVSNNGSIALVGDPFGGSNSAVLNVTGGMLTNGPSATITLDAGPDDPGVDLLNAALDNQGSLIVSSEGVLTGSITNSGTIHLLGAHVGQGNVLLPPADLTVNLTDSSTPFMNSGAITMDSLASLVVGGDLANFGTVTVGSFGILEVAGNYTQTDGLTLLGNGILTGGGLLDLEGGVLAGTGVINGNVLNNAEVDVGQPGSPGILTIVGDYTQTGGGDLVIEIGGLNPGTDFDQLNVTGQATLDGTLTVNLINGFQPASGDGFTIMTFSSGSGAFANLNGDGPLFTPSFDATDMTLVAN